MKMLKLLVNCSLPLCQRSISPIFCHTKHEMSHEQIMNKSYIRIHQPASVLEQLTNKQEVAENDQMQEVDELYLE